MLCGNILLFEDFILLHMVLVQIAYLGTERRPRLLKLESSLFKSPRRMCRGGTDNGPERAAVLRHLSNLEKLYKMSLASQSYSAEKHEQVYSVRFCKPSLRYVQSKVPVDSKLHKN